MKRTPRLTLMLLSVVASFISSSLPAQTKQTTRAELQAEIARLRIALDQCWSSKSSSNRDEAVASLRAVQSALNTGANLEEFKRYQIESRIKIDALPNRPDNQALREISDLFAGAVRFRIMYSTDGKIDANELADAQARYVDDTEITKTLSAMRSDDAILAMQAEVQSPNTDMPPARTERGKQLEAQIAEVNRELQKQLTESMRNDARRRNAEGARHISVLLLLKAEEKLLQLK